jgi:hypothetical protein
MEAESRVSEGAAKRLIAAGEKERAEFVRRSVGQDVADPAHYDLVVNTETYLGERAEAVVLMAYLAKFGEWPLTAQALNGEELSGPGGRLPSVDRERARMH